MEFWKYIYSRSDIKPVKGCLPKKVEEVQSDCDLCTTKSSPTKSNENSLQKDLNHKSQGNSLLQKMTLMDEIRGRNVRNPDNNSFKTIKASAREIFPKFRSLGIRGLM